MNFNDYDEEQKKCLDKAINSTRNAFNDYNKLTPKYKEEFFKRICGEAFFNQFAEYIRRNIK